MSSSVSYKPMKTRFKSGQQKHYTHKENMKTLNQLLKTPNITIKKTLLKNVQMLNFNELKKELDMKRKGNSECLNRISKTQNKKKNNSKQEKTIDEPKEYYPSLSKRKSVSNKIKLKPKNSYKVVGTTNKRKRQIPHYYKETKSLPPIPQQNRIPPKSPTMEELITMADDDLDDEGLLEILTCPSPVWWEDDDSHESIEEDFKQNKEITQLENNTQKVPDINSLFQKDGIESVKKADKILKGKRSKLQNILDNIKVKKFNLSSNNDKDGIVNLDKHSDEINDNSKEINDSTDIINDNIDINDSSDVINVNNDSSDEINVNTDKGNNNSDEMNDNTDINDNSDEIYDNIDINDNADEVNDNSDEINYISNEITDNLEKIIEDHVIIEIFDNNDVKSNSDTRNDISEVIDIDDNESDKERSSLSDSSINEDFLKTLENIDIPVNDEKEKQDFLKTLENIKIPVKQEKEPQNLLKTIENIKIAVKHEKKPQDIVKNKICNEIIPLRKSKRKSPIKTKYYEDFEVWTGVKRRRRKAKDETDKNEINTKNIKEIPKDLPILTKHPLKSKTKINKNVELDSISDTNIKFLDEDEDKNENGNLDSDLMTIYRILPSEPQEIDVEDQIIANLVSKDIKLQEKDTYNESADELNNDSIDSKNVKRSRKSKEDSTVSDTKKSKIRKTKHELNNELNTDYTKSITVYKNVYKPNKDVKESETVVNNTVNKDMTKKPNVFTNGVNNKELNTNNAKVNETSKEMKIEKNYAKIVLTKAEIKIKNLNNSKNEKAKLKTPKKLSKELNEDFKNSINVHKFLVKPKQTENISEIINKYNMKLEKQNAKRDELNTDLVNKYMNKTKGNLKGSQIQNKEMKLDEQKSQNEIKNNNFNKSKDEKRTMKKDVNIINNINNVKSKIKYCPKCSSVYDTDSCQYCIKKNKKKTI